MQGRVGPKPSSLALSVDATPFAWCGRTDQKRLPDIRTCDGPVVTHLRGSRLAMEFYGVDGDSIRSALIQTARDLDGVAPGQGCSPR